MVNHNSNHLTVRVGILLFVLYVLYLFMEKEECRGKIGKKECDAASLVVEIGVGFTYIRM